MPYGGGYSGYGLGGGSVGSSIAQGLQSGFEMGRQVDTDRERKAQLEFENQRQTEADARAQQTSDIANTHQAVLATQALIANHKARGDQLAQQYGGAANIPNDVGSAYSDEANGYASTLKGHLQKLAGYAGTVRQQAQDDASYMAANKLDPLDPKYPAKRLVQAYVGTLRRPATDLLPGPNGEAAPVAQAADDLEIGMKNGNEGLALKAANTLFAPELRTGVGQPSPHGGGDLVLGKQIVKILPAPGMNGPPDPNNPSPNDGKVTPIIRVFTGPSQSGADYSHEGGTQGTEQQLYGAPQGATGHYDAPVTENRSTDPNDPVAHISLEDGINRAQQLKTAATSLAGNPELMKKFQQGLQDLGGEHDEFLNAYHSMGGTMPPGSATTTKSYDKPTLEVTKDAQGNIVKRENFTPPAKEEPEKLGPVAQALQDIREDETLTPEQKTQAIAAHLKLTPKEAKEGGPLFQKVADIRKLVADKTMTEEEGEQAIHEAVTGKAGGMGGREGVFTTRVLTSANEAAKDLTNIVRLPVGASTGFFGSRHPGTSLMDAGLETLTNKLTTQQVQSYTTRSAGLQRSLAAIEASGLAPSGKLSEQMGTVLVKEGDTQRTQLEKLAQTRQIVEAGLESTAANPKLSPEQRKHAGDIIATIRKAIPFTMEDLDKLATLQDAKPNATLAQVIAMHGLGGNGMARQEIPTSAAPATGAPASGTGLTQPGDTDRADALQRAVADAQQRVENSPAGSVQQHSAQADLEAAHAEYEKVRPSPGQPTGARVAPTRAAASTPAKQPTVSNWQ